MKKDTDDDKPIKRDGIINMKSRIHERDMEKYISDLPSQLYDDFMDNTVNDDEVKGFIKKGISLFFKKLGDIISAIYNRIMGLLKPKR